MSRKYKKSMVRAIFASATLLISTVAFAQDLLVDINRTQVVYLPTAASAIVIGNPEIADVSVHSPDTVFVVGRGFGETNLVILDQAGQKIMDANVTVVNQYAPTSVRVHNLLEGSRKTYSCVPYCSPAPVLGDAPAFVGSFSGKGQAINNVSASGSISSAPMSGQQQLQSFGMTNPQDGPMGDSTIYNPASEIY